MKFATLENFNGKLDKLNLYGDATNTGYHKDLYRDYPYHFWELDKVRLSVVMQERFLEFNTIMIKYEDNDANN